jgi:hypothetical protein
MLRRDAISLLVGFAWPQPLALHFGAAAKPGCG